VTGKGLSEGTAANLGRAARGAVDAAGEAVSDLAGSAAKAGSGIANAASALPDQVRALTQGYNSANLSDRVTSSGSPINEGPMISNGGAGMESSGMMGRQPGFKSFNNDLPQQLMTQAQNQQFLAKSRALASQADSIANQDKLTEAQRVQPVDTLPNDLYSSQSRQSVDYFDPVL